MSVWPLILLAATMPLRNPFWPVGYEGEREAISDEARVQVRAPSPETASAEDSATAATAATAAAAAAAEDDGHYADRLWISARKALKIGGTMKAANGHQAVTINGRIYSEGDLVSANHRNRRFTWRVKGLTNGGTLKLSRIRYRQLETESDEKGSKQ